MPLILNQKDEMKWIEPNLDRPEIENLMKIYPDEDMDTYPLRTDYKKFNFSDKMLIENTKYQTSLNDGCFQ